MNPLTKRETTGAEAVPDLAIQSMGGARRMIQVLLLRGFSSAMTNKGSYVCSDPLRRHHRRPGRWVAAGRTTTPPAMVLMMTNSMTKTERMEIEVVPNLSRHCGGLGNNPGPAAWGLAPHLRMQVREALLPMTIPEVVEGIKLLKDSLL